MMSVRFKAAPRSRDGPDRRAPGPADRPRRPPSGGGVVHHGVGAGRTGQAHLARDDDRGVIVREGQAHAPDGLAERPVLRLIDVLAVDAGLEPHVSYPGLIDTFRSRIAVRLGSPDPVVEGPP